MHIEAAACDTGTAIALNRFIETPHKPAVAVFKVVLHYTFQTTTKAATYSFLLALALQDEKEPIFEHSVFPHSTE
ncbi:MAG: hypothetical protein ACFUZC_10685 [Chthoniobacteraceae bacterium]